MHPFVLLLSYVLSFQPEWLPLTFLALQVCSTDFMLCWFQNICFDFYLPLKNNFTVHAILGAFLHFENLCPAFFRVYLWCGCRLLCHCHDLLLSRFSPSLWLRFSDASGWGCLCAYPTGMRQQFWTIRLMFSSTCVGPCYIFSNIFLPLSLSFWNYKNL